MQMCTEQLCESEVLSGFDFEPHLSSLRKGKAVTLVCADRGQQNGVDNKATRKKSPFHVGLLTHTKYLFISELTLGISLLSSPPAGQK